MNMVIVRLIGGLGNQLFQYAAGRRIALVNQASLKLDLSAFKSYPLRTYRLNHFKIVETIASPAEVARLTQGGLKGILGWGWGYIQRCLPYHKRSVISERRLFHFDPDILRVSKNAYLVGSWQNQEYFKDIDDILRREFTVKHAPDHVNQAMSRLMDQTESVSLHIRRGDYVSNQITNRVHGVRTLEYYQAAIEHLFGTAKQPHLFIFSDDTEWAQQNLRPDCAVTYVTHNGKEKDYEDLRLMSQCKHHIIANSSFSWWGAWLCRNPHKIVIAPKKWLNDPDIDTEDLIPDSWVKI